MSPMWLNSKCGSGMWLHDWLIEKQTEYGLIEYCYRCGKTRLFSTKEPNDTYLSYHLRMSLNPRYTPAEFHVEYERKTTHDSFI